MRQTDAELLALYAQGQADAARALTARFTPKVYAHALHMLGNSAEAEDVTQEALLRLWQVAPDWQAGGAQVRTWLYRVTANLCLDRLRRKQTTALEDAPDIADGAPGADDTLQSQARMDALQAALMQLPDRQRQAVVLRHIEGLGNPEIGTIMGLGTRAVESLTARGRRALTDLLATRKKELGYADD